MHFVGEAGAGDVSDRRCVKIEQHERPMVSDDTAALLVDQSQLLLAEPATLPASMASHDL